MIWLLVLPVAGILIAHLSYDRGYMAAIEEAAREKYCVDSDPN